MTLTETITILRQFNEWRRGDYEPSEQPEQPNPYEVGLAIDAAVEMIERLEAAEKEREEFKRACFGHISDNSLLQAKITEMEQQEPVAWWGRGPRDGRIELIVHKPAPSVMRDFAVTPLYALPGAKG